MTDPNLPDLLELAGERTSVSPPPVEQMVAGARRTRRRRTLMLTGATAAAVVATIGGVSLLPGPGTNSRDQTTPAASHSPTPTTPGEVSARTGLDGTWTVRALVGANGQSVLPNSAHDHLRMTFTDGQMTGTTGCNDIFGVYVQSGDEGQDLRFSPDQLGTTLVGCTDEAPLVSRLLDVRHISGAAGVRYLHAENWMIIVELRRS